MSLPTRPKAWAVHLSHMLDLTGAGTTRFPVRVAALAREYTAQVFPSDPIRRVEGRGLPGFEGALIPIRSANKGWGIAFNNAMRSPGRIRWTLAHELGHYLLHRNDLPDGITCSQEDVLGGGRDKGRDIEREADEFAAGLLMPFDDYRRQLAARDTPTIELLSACAERYGVSLLAAVLRWLDYTELRGVAAVSRDGFLLWSRSSEPAFKSGAYFATRKTTVELPSQSLAARHVDVATGRQGLVHPAGIWLQEEVTELVVTSEQYDLTMSLLLLNDNKPRWTGEPAGEEEDSVAIALDRRWSH